MKKETRMEIYNQAIEWVQEAGEQIRKTMHDPLEIETKSDANDLVTIVDKNTEAFFVDNIQAKYPSHRIVGEEGYVESPTTLEGTVWIIDPIDGTMNFVHQKRNFAISVGIYQDGVGEVGIIYDVMADVLYHAIRGEGAYKDDVKLPKLTAEKTIEEAIIGMNHFWLCENPYVQEKKMQEMVKKIRGTRTYGSAALEFAYTAEGIMDGYLSMNLAPWDVAAGMVLVKEVGGVTTDIDGNELSLTEKSSTLTCNRAVMDYLYDEIKQGRK